VITIFIGYEKHAMPLSHAFFTHWYAENFSGITYKNKKNVQKTKKNKKNGKFYPQKFEYYNLMSYLCNG